MIVRCGVKCPAIRRLRVYWPRASQRRYSNPSPPVSVHGAPSTPILEAFTNELDHIAPRFEIEGSQIQILRSPAEFYETLKSKILAAEERIFLSTLYIGKTEHELVSFLQAALRAKPALKLSILTDALRGTRESPDASTASLLAPLVTEFGNERVEIRMYHTPNLMGWRKKYIPKRINEGWGLQHMKLYGFDQEIMISGANLSHDYFTNRQDRYHLLKRAEITDFFATLHHTIAKLSFLLVPDPQLQAGYTLEWPSSNLAPSPLSSPSKYISQASIILKQLIQPSKLRTASSSKTNTIIYPLCQLTPFFPHTDASTELPVITSILSTLSSPTYKTSCWTFTAGYFNPLPALTKLLLSTSSTKNSVITASPWANGFYGSKGVSGLLPAAYTLLSRRFLQATQRYGRSSDVVLKEWRLGTVGEPGGWTYHAKGLWIALNSPPQSTDPSQRPRPRDPVEISIVGSSNYTQRSYRLDLEAGIAIVTHDALLQSRLTEERDGLGAHAHEVGLNTFVQPDRRIGISVRLAMWIVRVAGGAL